MYILVNHEIFLNMREAKFFIQPLSRKNSVILTIRSVFKIDIREAPKSYEFSKHGQGEIFLFRLHLIKIQLL